MRRGREIRHLGEAQLDPGQVEDCGEGIAWKAGQAERVAVKGFGDLAVATNDEGDGRGVGEWHCGSP